MVRILNRIISKNSKYIIGLLSGTSVDGIDAVLVKVQGSGIFTKLKVVDFVTVKIPVKIRNAVLKNSDNKTAKIAEITRLNVILGNIFAQAVRIIQRRNPSVKIDLIGSHGQTIHHLPGKYGLWGYKVKSTLQIGDPSVIANFTGITTIGDFRIADCAVGGDGAPLVPYLDYILFRSTKHNRGLVNIGGISNITILPKSCSKNDVIAFDTGPGNMLIDSLMQRLHKKHFDKNGAIAKRGSLNDKLFRLLLNDKYYKRRPPKSTGREHYGGRFTEKVMKNAGKIPGADIIRTVTEFTAYSVWYNYEKFIKRKIQIDELIVSGGGANNPVIMKSLINYFRCVKIKRMDSYGINPDSKEAVLFAVLANECLAGNCANMKSVTGSKKDVILGKICLAEQKLFKK